MIRRPPRSTLSSSSAASDVYKRQGSSTSNTLTIVASVLSLVVTCIAGFTIWWCKRSQVLCFGVVEKGDPEGVCDSTGSTDSNTPLEDLSLEDLHGDAAMFDSTGSADSNTPLEGVGMVTYMENPLGSSHTSGPFDVWHAEHGALLERMFIRYDLDDSGTLSDAEELECLTINLVTALQLKVPLQEIDEVIAPPKRIIGDGHHWSYEDFVGWFYYAFIRKVEKQKQDPGEKDLGFLEPI
eukprot:TRINITY_DN5051_c0_g1_i3.p1 TRINITY_DN5051_c0_g1~~TRINITY_DN5051_c0_g1_i3.p1  ORF type:complete len:239 (-),score=52.96 TRINITY_DN5051_c0_g1_i3:22-738(-)